MSKGEIQRFRDALSKIIPFWDLQRPPINALSNDVRRVSWNGDYTKKLADVLAQHGWDKSPLNRATWPGADGILLTKNGKWPIIVTYFANTKITNLLLPDNDTIVGGDEDTQFAQRMRAMAKKFMPSGFDVSRSGESATWSKRGGHAGLNIIARAVEKALTLGFKQGDHSYGGSPDGSTTGSGTTYTHPEGWILKTSYYGQTAYSNYFSMTLTYDASRGL